MIVKLVPETPPEREVQLTLTMAEARVLLTVVGRVGGRPKSGEREILDAIWSGLLGCGVDQLSDGKLTGTLYLQSGTLHLQS